MPFVKNMIAMGALVLMPTPVLAEDEAFSFEDFLAEPRTYTIDEMAADMAYGYCIPYLVGQFPLIGNATLAERGFSEKVSKSSNPRFGEVEQVTATQADGSISFGGVPDKVCQVSVVDADFDAVLARLRKNMSYMGLDFQPDAANSGDRGIAELETFKTPADGQMLYVQLARVAEPKPAVVAQLFVMAE